MPDVVEVFLLVVRTTEQGEALMKGKYSPEYMKAAAVILLSKKDLEKISVETGKTVHVQSDVGSVVVRALESDETIEGLAAMPLGPWANRLVPAKLDDSGVFIHGGVKVTVKKTSEPVASLDSLFKPSV